MCRYLNLFHSPIKLFPVFSVFYFVSQTEQTTTFQLRRSTIACCQSKIKSSSYFTVEARRDRFLISTSLILINRTPLTPVRRDNLRLTRTITLYLSIDTVLRPKENHYYLAARESRRDRLQIGTQRYLLYTHFVPA